MRLWLRLFQGSRTWWQKALLIGFLLLAVWGTVTILVPAVVAFTVRLFEKLVDAAPLIILLIMLTYMMGKPGRTIRKGVIGLLDKIITAFFALLGVSIPKEKKKKKDEEEDGD